MPRLASYLKHYKHIYFAALTTCLIFGLDQWTKYLVLHHLPHNYTLTSYLNLVLVYNTGISFGLLHNFTYGKWFFIIAAFAVVIGLWIWFLRSQPRFAILIGMITGGALGNILDRLWYPGVIDFLDFHYGTWHYPAFNIADCAIVLAVLGILLYEWTPKTSPH